MKKNKPKTLIRHFLKVIVIILLLSFSLPAIGHSQEKDIEKLIEDMISSPNSPRGATVADELVKIGASAVESLIFTLERRDNFKYRDINVKIKVIEILGIIRDTRAIGPLIDILKLENNPNIRGEAAGALVRIGAPTVEPLIAALKDENKNVRYEIAWALGEIRDQRAMKPLITILQKDKDADVRRTAAWAVGRVYSYNMLKDFSIIKLLFASAKSGVDSGVRGAAVYALGEISSGDQKDTRVVDFLIGLLKDKDILVRSRAAEVLGLIKDPRALEPLITAMKDDNPLVRKNAVNTLWLKDERAVEPLISLLNDKDKEVRSASAAKLREFKDPRALESLIIALKDENPDVRGIAVSAIGELGDSRAIGHLISSLKDEKNYIRGKAIKALVMIGEPAVEALNIALKNDDIYVRGRAAFALALIKDPNTFKPLFIFLDDGRISIKDDRVVSVTSVKSKNVEQLLNIGWPMVEPLVAILKDGNADIAAFALGQLKDSRAVEPLIDVMGNIGCAAAEALAEIKDQRAIEPLIAPLRWKTSYADSVQHCLRKALAKFGISVVEPLIALLNNENEYVQERAKNILIEIGAPAVKPLIAILKDEDENVRVMAVKILGRIKDTSTVELLIAALKDEDEDVRYEAAAALENIKDARAVKPLIIALEDEDNNVSKRASQALSGIGIPALITALGDKDEGIRRKIADELVKVQRTSAPGYFPVEHLIAALEDKNPHVRYEIAWVLDYINDSRGDDSLIASMKKKKMAIIAGAYSFFISRGEAGTEALLIKALNKYGDIVMAMDFINSGNSQLEAAGNAWVKKHNYTIITQANSSNVKWGSKTEGVKGERPVKKKKATKRMVQ